jgi:hypothetical protein
VVRLERVYKVPRYLYPFPGMAIQQDVLRTSYNHEFTSKVQHSATAQVSDTSRPHFTSTQPPPLTSLDFTASSRKHTLGRCAGISSCNPSTTIETSAAGLLFCRALSRGLALYDLLPR